MNRAFFFCITVFILSENHFGLENFPDESLEVGLERLHATAPAEDALFSGIAIKYFLSPQFFLGSTQSSLTFRKKSEYRPDFHAGVRIPFLDNFAWEGAIGVDFFTALIIALYIVDEDNAIDYKFASNFYSPYFTLSAGIRYELKSIALRFLTQTQFGGYLEDQNGKFNASLWLGLGISMRFPM